MTSEIAILNKEAVALATDSAVTINEGKKIYNSANKLFCLSKYQPVGIMIYGNATFMGVPFETIIKMFRESLNNDAYPYLKEYSKRFIEFININKIKISKKEQEEYLTAIVITILNQIKNKIEEYWKKEIENFGKIKLNKMQNIASIIIKNYLNNFSNKELSCFPKKHLSSLKKDINKIFNKKRKDLFQEYTLSRTDIGNLREIIHRATTKNNFPNWHTGIVIAGFGEKEIYPAIESYSIEALFNGKVKYRLERSDNIEYAKEKR
ncbi:MAG: hypothetical protein GY777_24345 [Candidatus Brocadiaceae bacterium]|nr:hypothetical protein [Candidatus Brocadiaceae bacterium]